MLHILIKIYIQNLIAFVSIIPNFYNHQLINPSAPQFCGEPNNNIPLYRLTTLSMYRCNKEIQKSYMEFVFAFLSNEENISKFEFALELEGDF